MREKSTVVFVVGMHRSGTSAMAGALQTIGLELGHNLLEGNRHNPRGYFENREVVDINNDLLAALGAGWDTIVPMEKGWEAAAELAPFTDRIRSFLLKSLEQYPLLGIKDPRLGITLPLWQRVLDELAISHSYILMLRHPLEICQSLAFRDFMSTEKALMMWANAMLTLECATRPYPRTIASFEAFQADPFVTVEKVSYDLAMPFSMSAAVRKVQLETFINPSLKHHQAAKEHAITGQPAFLGKLRVSLQQLLQAPAEKAIWSQIDGIRTAFLQYARLFYPKESQELLRISWLQQASQAEEVQVGGDEALGGKYEQMLLENENLREQLEEYVALYASSSLELTHTQNLLTDEQAKHQALKRAFSTRLGWALTGPLRKVYGWLMSCINH